MTLEARKSESSMVPSLCFATSNSEDVFPHEEDPTVISVITMGRTMHRVLVGHGSLADVMYWEMFLGLQVPLGQL